VRQILINAISWIGCAILFYGLLNIRKEVDFPGIWAVIPVSGAVFLILGGPEAWFNRVVLSNRVAIWIGLISYPLYLWHWPILSFARIVEGEMPSRNVRIVAVLLSAGLAWLTVKLIERPFRHSNHRMGLKLSLLCIFASGLGIFGLVVGSRDFSKSHGFEKVLIERKGFEHGFGTSLNWYRGKQDWLFLGNAHNAIVAKQKLAILPSKSEIESIRLSFKRLAEAGMKAGTKIFLIIGPNKSTIYPEYLPDELVQSPKRYINFFLDRLVDIPNLVVYDPTEEFLKLKGSQGALYWRTDTHWNAKGAFLAFSGFAHKIGVPVPLANFQLTTSHSGDLIGISKLQNFPLHSDDNWEVVLKNRPELTVNLTPNEQKTSFGNSTVVFNSRPLSAMYIWVVGDSFTGSLQQFFNATFKEVRYVGHYYDKLEDLPGDLANVKRKPDIVVVVRTERTF